MDYLGLLPNRDSHHYAVPSELNELGAVSDDLMRSSQANQRQSGRTDESGDNASVDYEPPYEATYEHVV